MRDRHLKVYRVALDLFITLRLNRVCSDLYPFIIFFVVIIMDGIHKVMMDCFDSNSKHSARRPRRPLRI